MSGFGRSETILGAAPGAHDVLDTADVAPEHLPLLPTASLECMTRAAVICRRRASGGIFGIAAAAQVG